MRIYSRKIMSLYLQNTPSEALVFEDVYAMKDPIASWRSHMWKLVVWKENDQTTAYQNVKRERETDIYHNNKEMQQSESTWQDEKERCVPFRC